jgi:hypothetical protein
MDRILLGAYAMIKATSLFTLSMTLAATVAGCQNAEPQGDEDNPFTQDLSDSGKEDSAYMNLDGREMEIDLEGDVTGASNSQLNDAPAVIGQYALTYFRKKEQMYIESLAEDATTGNRAEWFIDGRWLTPDRVPAGAVRKHWRLRGLNTVMLFKAAKNVKLGDSFVAKVPAKPFSVMADAGKKCADSDDHIGLDASVYWYRWLPEQASCTIPLQDLKVTVSKVFDLSTPANKTYPEYDQLIADHKLTAVVMFGQIDDGAITASEPGMKAFAQYARWLKAAKFAEVTAPLGKRFEKLVNGTTVQIDLYSPKEFSGLDDLAHFGNFQKAISEHEIVVWDGHSMLGGSDFWSRPTYPSTYQIFLYGGCLGFEYYVKPILHGKGDSWAKLDLMSSVIEVTATANDFAAPAIAKIVWALSHGNRSSWRDILGTVRTNVGDSTFGVSGVRDNCFTPTGSRCH